MTKLSNAQFKAWMMGYSRGWEEARVHTLRLVKAYLMDSNDEQVKLLIERMEQELALQQQES